MAGSAARRRRDATDSPPPERRSGRRARRERAPVSGPAYITRRIPTYELVSEDWPRPDRGPCRPHPEGGRHRVPRRRRGAAALQGGRRGCQRPARPLRAGPGPGALPNGAAQLHPSRAQPRALGRDRRRQHGLLAGLWRALRARPGGRPPLRLDPGLRQLRQAGLPLALAAPFRRHHLRAGRHPGEQAPPRHGLRTHALVGQSLHGLGDRAGAGRGLDRALPHPLRRRFRGRELRHPGQHQRQLAPGLRRRHVRGRAGPTPPPTRRPWWCPSSSAVPWAR